ncbi:hypothetical protein EVB35_042 [Rhizobium phage RHph_TM34]|uniref:Uncharacterized protein n=1 Tax=Rhizobium phage RHph_TM34 TaxID=2509556 RepID=A0A7S5QW24_9CAUD|nr:hypothetical protein EVB35_042 [Rhizobium phage RHph_TM34]
MSLHVKQAGAWSTVQNLYVNQSGVWVPVQYAYVKNAGAWVQYYSSEVVVTLAANTNNVNISTLFTSAVWTSSTNKRVVINSGVTIGSTSSGTPAMRTGVSWGGLLTIENAGTIQGAGGAGNSGAGGHALIADASGVIVKNTGIIRSGGGGGGHGGNGGNGYYTYTISEGPAYAGYPANGSSRYYWQTQNGTSIDSAYWNNANLFGGNVDSPVTVNGFTYTRGAQRASYTSGSSSFNVFEISRSYQATAYTSGGAGGDGGRGQGADGSAAAGSAGSGGGTNAGTGGTGGTGGAYGANGSTGNSGSAGNNGSGTAGTTGGLAGISYNVANISMTNTGTITGRTS